MRTRAIARSAAIICLLLGRAVCANIDSPGALDAEGAVRMGEVQRGALLVPLPEPGSYASLPSLHTDVHIRASGIVAKVDVRQRFENRTGEWLEAVYVFPLPDQAAVTRLRLRIGERIVEGRIRERTEAKRTYLAAKAAGKRTGLVEQERPNLFTTSVANVAPGEAITVELDYVETLEYRDGEFSLRFPLVAGPRYIPGSPLAERAQTSGTGWALDTDVVPDASRITPPVAVPGSGKLNPVKIVVELDSGFPIGRIDSPYHSVQLDRPGERTATLRLDGPVYADRDFELRWSPQRGTEPRAAVFTEQVGGRTYALLLVVPPAEEEAARLVRSRDLILVIDTSGSMHGLSIAQARSAAGFALDQLTAADTFNVIQFNSSTGRLFPVSQPATAQALTLARAYLSSLQAEGGTEMAGALHAALEDDGSNTRVRQVVFITDGNVGNESQLFGIIERRLGNSRLFTVGIGSAPNAFFMRRAAEFGRGTFTFIGKQAEVASKMETLFVKLKFPLLTDVAVAWPDAAGVDAWPQSVPDLYRGEPLVSAGRMDTAATQAVVTGNLGDQPWRFAVPVGDGAESEGIAVAWARQKIKNLMDRRFGGDGDETLRASIQREVTELGIEHHLVTRYTSLVAVDVTPARGAAERLRSRALPTNLPHGWSYQHVFGLPATATGAPLKLLAGLAMIGLAFLWLCWIKSRAYCSLSRPRRP